MIINSQVNVINTRALYRSHVRRTWPVVSRAMPSPPGSIQPIVGDAGDDEGCSFMVVTFGIEVDGIVVVDGLHVCGKLALCCRKENKGNIIRMKNTCTLPLKVASAKWMTSYVAGVCRPTRHLVLVQCMQSGQKTS